MRKLNILGRALAIAALLGLVALPEFLGGGQPLSRVEWESVFAHGSAQGTSGFESAFATLDGESETEDVGWVACRPYGRRGASLTALSTGYPLSMFVRSAYRTPVPVNVSLLI